MADPVRSRDERFTYGQYKTWPDEERWELIEGVAWSMCAAPLRMHQELSQRLAMLFGMYLQDKPCKIFTAPFDVLFPEEEEEDDEVNSVVQPDLVVYCDRSKLTKAGARGAPDLLVEILSPSTSKKDLNDKFKLYEKQGVREYWVVDPDGRWLCVYRRKEDGRFDVGELREPLRNYKPIASSVLEGFELDPLRLFADLD